MNRSSFMLKIAVRIFALLVILVAVGAASSQAQAPTNDGLSLSEGTAPFASGSAAPAAAPPISGTGIVVKQGMEFVPYVPTTTLANNYGWVYKTGTGSGNIEGWMDIPHGVRVNKVVVYFYDADPTYDLAYYLDFYPNTGGYATILVNGKSSGTPGYSYLQANVPNFTIDLTAGTLVVEVLLPPSANVRLGMVRLDHSAASYLPAVMR